MSKSNYDEIRRVRHEMSAKVGHDIGKLIDLINQDREKYADRIINPGKAAEECKPLALPLANENNLQASAPSAVK